MLVPTQVLLQAAQNGRFAIGAFNIYNLEGVKAVLQAGVAQKSPIMLQIHPKALAYGGVGLIALCLESARVAPVPVAVHLDHSTNIADIRQALEAGVSSIMADGSGLSYEANLQFMRLVQAYARPYGVALEAELGRISGTEDDLTVAEWEARLTDPDQAAHSVANTHIDALAVCIGNVHGVYHAPPNLDWARLEAIQRAVPTPLVLHGTSGLPDEMIECAIELGVCKFNVNTEVRQAFVTAVHQTAQTDIDLVPMMSLGVEAMVETITAKLRLFGSCGQANAILGA